MLSLRVYRILFTSALINTWTITGPGGSPAPRPFIINAAQRQHLLTLNIPAALLWPACENARPQSEHASKRKFIVLRRLSTDRLNWPNWTTFLSFRLNRTTQEWSLSRVSLNVRLPQLACTEAVLRWTWRPADSSRRRWRITSGLTR